MAERDRSRPNRDPDRRRPAPTHPGFYALPAELPLDVCARCAATVPATDRSRELHREDHRKADERTTP